MPRHSCNTVGARSTIVDIACKTDNFVGASSHALGEYEPWFVGDLSGQSDEGRQQGEGPERGSHDEGFLLCPPRVLGYSTKEKMWGQFGVDQTSDAPGKQISKFNEKLQLDEGYKGMIQALVDEHEGGAEIKDIVEDKGKGLVLLLHGELGPPLCSLF